MMYPYEQINSKAKFIKFKDYQIHEFYCINPDCACNKVDLHFISYIKHEYKTMYSFTLYLDDLKYDQIKINQKQKDVKEEIEAFLKQTDLKVFKNHFIEAKMYGLTIGIDLEDIDFKNNMHGYNEFFDYEKLLPIKIKDKIYYIYDTYCIDPDCHCEHAVLYFIYLNSNPFKYQITLTLDLKFQNNTIEILAKTCSDDDATLIIEEFKKRKDYRTLFNNRYLTIKELDQYLPQEDDYFEDEEDFDDLSDSFAKVDDMDIEDFLNGFEEDFLEETYKHHFKSNDFKTLLNQLTLNEIKDSYHTLTGSTQNSKKQQFIQLIDETFTNKLDNILKNYHSEILDDLFKMVKNNGELSHKEIPDGFAILMKLSLIAFPVRKNNTYKLVMSDKCLDYLKSIDKAKLYKHIKENDIIITYMKKLLEVYGEFDLDLLKHYLETYESITINLFDHQTLFDFDSFYRGTYDVNFGTFALFGLEEMEAFQELNNDLPYYELSKDDIYNNAYTKEEQQFIKFYQNELNLNEEEVLEVLYSLKELIQNNVSIEQIYKAIGEIKSDDSLWKETKILIEAIYNNTRLFSLKGHTRNEVKKQKLIAFKK